MPAANVVLTFELASAASLGLTPPLEGWQCGVPVGQADKFVCSNASFSPFSDLGFDVTARTATLPQQVTAFITATSTSTATNLGNNQAVCNTYAGIFSANGNPWDVSDINYSADSGSMITAGQDSFSGWGGLRLRVLDGCDVILTDNVALTGFDLDYTGTRRWGSTTFLAHSGVSISRFILAPAFADYVRYGDVFANTPGATRVVNLARGGNLGSNTSSTVAATSNGDLNFTATDN